MQILYLWPSSHEAQSIIKLSRDDTLNISEEVCLLSVTWQLGLVEREINEILQGILARQEARPNQTAKKYANIAAHMGHDLDGGQPVMQQREIGEDDVCPICQDELLAKHLPVTYCK